MLDQACWYLEKSSCHDKMAARGSVPRDSAPGHHAREGHTKHLDCVVWVKESIFIAPLVGKLEEREESALHTLVNAFGGVWPVSAALGGSGGQQHRHRLPLTAAVGCRQKPIEWLLPAVGGGQQQLAAGRCPMSRNGHTSPKAFTNLLVIFINCP